MYNKEALLKAVKEPIRLLVLALIPFALAYLSVIDAQWAIGLTVALKFADKYLHELGKTMGTARKESPLTRGLTRF